MRPYRWVSTLSGPILLAGIVVAFLQGPAAIAEPIDPDVPASFALASSTATISRDDGTASFTVSVTNLTNKEITIGQPATATQHPCKPTIVSGNPVAPAVTGTLKIDLDSTAEACKSSLVGGEKFDLVAGNTTATVEVTDAPEGDIDWIAILTIFGLSIGGALVLLLLAYWSWKHFGNVPPGATIEPGLPYLEATYKFSDSWATNTTLLIGVLTAVLGSTDVLDAIGKTATKNAQAQTVAGSAISVALIAAAPVILQMTRHRVKMKADAGPPPIAAGTLGREYANTMFGVFAAGAVTLGAGCGLIWIVARASSDLELDGIQNYWIVLGLVPTVLLAVYGFTNMWVTLITGKTEPPTAKESDALAAARLVSTAILASRPSQVTTEGQPSAVDQEWSKASAELLILQPPSTPGVDPARTNRRAKAAAF